MRTLDEAKRNAASSMHKLARFSGHWMTAIDFENHIDRMETHFQTYEEIWLTGHFDTSFYERVRGLPQRYSTCDFRVLAINPGRNRDNLNTLRYLENAEAKVKIHRKLHARMFIGCNETTDTMILILGTYDFNRDGIGRNNINVGMHTNNPEMIQKAKDFFQEQWDSVYTYEVPQEDTT